ncbi:NEDD8-conjugating enzyme Ubc12, partial [Mucuna pruriens]
MGKPSEKKVTGCGLRVQWCVRSQPAAKPPPEISSFFFSPFQLCTFLKQVPFNPNSPLFLIASTMIKLFKVKEKQREQAENAGGGPPVKKQSAGELRLHKDISELNLPTSCTIQFPNGKDDLMNFEVTIRPDEGYYLGGTFLFTFQVSPIYPHEAPKVKCKTKLYHPNIDLEGNVCLNILREDWKPVLNINTVIYGLYHLFTEPNYEDPLNHEAAAVLRENPKLFESNVKRAMAGGYVGQTYFNRCM